VDSFSYFHVFTFNLSVQIITEPLEPKKTTSWFKNMKKKNKQKIQLAPKDGDGSTYLHTVWPKVDPLCKQLPVLL